MQPYLATLHIGFLAGAMWLSRLALAHVGHGNVGSGSIWDGMLHPVTGPDHMAAMIAVGLWGAQLGSPALWIMPVTFPLVMALGGFMGLVGMPLPGVNAGVAISGIVLGGAVAAALHAPLWLAGLVVAFFGFFHGHAHGVAMPMSGSPLAFGAGFVVATGMLHLCGVAIGFFIRWPIGTLLIRVAGGATAATGAYYLLMLARRAGG